MGLNFKLDVGLYRLDSQAACQRYRQTTIDAKTASIKDSLRHLSFSLNDYAMAA